MSDRRSGFTLIEMLVVVAVIATLAILGVGYYTDYLEEARAAVVRSNLRTVRDALARHFKDRLAYPTTLEALQGPYLQDSYQKLLLHPWGDGEPVQVLVVVPATGTPGVDSNAFLATETETVAYPGHGGRQIRDVKLKRGGVVLPW
ncbi:MAG: putative secretion system X protein GspG-like 2 [Candidatus Ozemobacter sibiricus]|uniref:Putative secretion system X protein GspG-like 2 n=1 Tax=Candidatus Ozemobacter sibiricus TaxID=2268124 RepID=A0A367ZTR3_9BACT|nr:MAG: putative secretion system X protein GspG-like 2 [Candidatus Ozemobacter sibiricus]